MAELSLERFVQAVKGDEVSLVLEFLEHDPQLIEARTQRGSILLTAL